MGKKRRSQCKLKNCTSIELENAIWDKFVNEICVTDSCQLFHTVQFRHVPQTANCLNYKSWSIDFLRLRHQKKNEKKQQKKLTKTMSFGLPEWRVCHLPSLSLAMSSKGHPHHLPKNEATAKKYLFSLWTQQLTFPPNSYLCIYDLEFFYSRACGKNSRWPRINSHFFKKKFQHWNSLLAKFHIINDY